jgi:hypothetical protein
MSYKSSKRLIWNKYALEMRVHFFIFFSCVGPIVSSGYNHSSQLVDLLHQVHRPTVG